MVWRAAVVWLLIAVVAVLNGGLRERLYRKPLGDDRALALSTLLLSGAIFGIAACMNRWIGIDTLQQSWLVGAGWVLATILFEFVAGHYLFGNPWSKIIADYNPFRGRVWLLIPLATLTSLPLASRGLPEMYILPYVISLAVAVLILVFAYMKPVVARWLLGAVFLYACIYNSWLAVLVHFEFSSKETISVMVQT